VNTNIIHTGFLDNLSGFFKNTCSIQEFTITYNDYNEPVKSWSDKFSDIPCAIGEDDSKGSTETKEGDKTVRKSTYRIVLKGDYEIDETMRVSVGSDYYDIIQVVDDLRGIKTSVICEKVEV
jgi:head-tail adaptor